MLVRALLRPHILVRLSSRSSWTIVRSNTITDCNKRIRGTKPVSTCSFSLCPSSPNGKYICMRFLPSLQLWLLSLLRSKKLASKLACFLPSWPLLSFYDYCYFFFDDDVRPNVTQLMSLKIRRSTFLSHVKFAERRILKLRKYGRVGRVGTCSKKQGSHTHTYNAQPHPHRYPTEHDAVLEPFMSYVNFANLQILRL